MFYVIINVPFTSLFLLSIPMQTLVLFVSQVIYFEIINEKTVYTNTFNYNKKINLAPSKVLKSISITASKTPTTLWLDKTDIFKNSMFLLKNCSNCIIIKQTVFCF